MFLDTLFVEMMPSQISFAAAIALLTSFLACTAVRRIALRLALFDQPNERSLHKVPVPRLGGVGIVGACGLTCPLLWILLGLSPARDLLLLLGLGLVIAALGLLDDLRPLSAATRFPLQVAAAVLLVALLPHPQSISMANGLDVRVPAAMQMLLFPLCIVALLNIYNFMDGMDGLAGTQAIGAGLAMMAAFEFEGHHDLALVSGCLAGASGGFLIVNFPPAKIFMGDSGSTFLGFCFAGLAIVGVTRSPAAILAPAALALSPFLLDGSFTLCRRALRGEAVWKAHRTHLYQRAVGSGLTHRHVLVWYSIWVMLAGVGGMIAPVVGRSMVGGLAAVMLCCLGIVWTWVTWREREHQRTLIGRRPTESG